MVSRSSSSVMTAFRWMYLHEGEHLHLQSGMEEM